MKNQLVTCLRVLLVTLVFCGLAIAQELHPGPRSTCAICNARMVADYISSRTSPISKSEKIRLIKRIAPEANSNEVLRVLDQIDSLSIPNMRIQHDESFQPFWVEFGDGIQKPLYTLKSSNATIRSSNNADEIFESVEELSTSKESAYLLVDDIYNVRSQNFVSNLNLYKARNLSSKIRAIESDIYMVNEVPSRWGTPLFARRPELVSVTEPEKISATQYRAQADFIAEKKNVALRIYAKTKANISGFLDNLKSVLRRSPEVSIAGAVNRSRRLSKPVKIVYDEASYTQLIKLHRISASADVL